MPSAPRRSPSDLHDQFPWSPARDAVVALVRGYGALQRQMEPYFARFGITPPQFQVLTILNRLQGQDVAQRRLARELYVSFPNVTVMLARLEKARLVRRRTNPRDHRQKLTLLTRRGKALLHRIWREHQQQLDQVMAGLSGEEQAELARLLNKMITAHLDRSAGSDGAVGASDGASGCTAGRLGQEDRSCPRPVSR